MALPERTPQAPAPTFCLDLHTRKNAIIPDLLVHNFPSDWNRNSAVSVETIFNIKTLWINRSEFFYRTLHARTAPRATATKVRNVRHGYLTVAEKLDISCTVDNGTAPFLDAIQT